jgi:hypothetical protein
MADRYRINIDKKWSLEDLYVFSRTYEQVYFLAYSLFPDLPDEAVGRVLHAYQVFPWRGGYSAVNFYNQLKYAVPSVERPEVKAIRYASPGFIELGLLVSVAASVSLLVKHVAGTIERINSVYNTIISDLQRRKLLRLEVKRKELELSIEQNQAIGEHANMMARMLGFDGHRELTKRTGHAFITLKILLSYYRRLKKLADFQAKGKANL